MCWSDCLVGACGGWSGCLVGAGCACAGLIDLIACGSSQNATSAVCRRLSFGASDRESMPVPAPWPAEDLTDTHRLTDLIDTTDTTQTRQRHGPCSCGPPLPPTHPRSSAAPSGRPSCMLQGPSSVPSTPLARITRARPPGRAAAATAQHGGMPPRGPPTANAPANAPASRCPRSRGRADHPAGLFHMHHSTHAVQPAQQAGHRCRRTQQTQPQQRHPAVQPIRTLARLYAHRACFVTVSFDLATGV